MSEAGKPSRWRRFKASIVGFLDFCNVLDDATKKMSPVKLNVWAANAGVVSTALATGFAFIAGHVSGIETVWGGAMTWLTHAHTVHHFDKRERNRSTAALARVATGQSTIPAGASTVTTVKET